MSVGVMSNEPRIEHVPCQSVHLTNSSLWSDEDELVGRNAHNVALFSQDILNHLWVSSRKPRFFVNLLPLDYPIDSTDLTKLVIRIPNIGDGRYSWTRELEEWVEVQKIDTSRYCIDRDLQGLLDMQVSHEAKDHVRHTGIHAATNIFVGKACKSVHPIKRPLI